MVEERADVGEAPRPRVVRRHDERGFERVDRARGTFVQVLVGPNEQAPNFYTRRFRIQPGGRIPEHRHETIEHEQYVLRGELTIGLDGRERRVTRGDAVFIPAGTAHWYENRGEGPVEFLCVVPRTDVYQTEWLEEREG